MPGQWTSNKLEGSPHRIRPETHWFQETTRKGRKDGRLWFSLRLRVDRAKELCDAFAGAGEPNDFAGLVNKTFKTQQGEVEKAVMMAPTSHAALRFAFDAKADPGQQRADHGSPNSAKAEKTEPMLGTDILVHPTAFPELEKLWSLSLKLAS